MSQYAFILPDARTKGEMRAIEIIFSEMTKEQVGYAMHCVKSWGFGQGSYAEQFLGAMRRAAKKARNNLP